MTKYDIIYTKLDKSEEKMQAYHENEGQRLSGKRIYFTKNTVREPSAMAMLHWHNSYELLFVRRGYGEQQINQKKLNFKSGDAVVIRPGDIHTTYAFSQDGCEIDVIQFIDDYFGERAELISDVKSCVIEDADVETVRLFDRIAENTRDGARDSLILSGELFTLCGKIAERCEGKESVGGRTEFAEAVCRHVGSASDTGLKAVSSFFGYSAEHFSRRFHKEVGVSYKYYCERIKMQKFIGLLEKNEQSVQQIAEQSGYSDASSFARAFKRIYGCTPGAYRALKIK